MSLEIIIRYLVLIFSLATLPAIFLLVKHFVEDDAEDTLVKWLIAVLFMTFTIALVITAITEIQILFFSFQLEGVVFLSILRDLIKSIVLCGISWTLLYIRRIK